MIQPRGKQIVVDVDTQKHFFDTSGIAVIRNCNRVLANIQKVVSWAQAKRIRVISTVQVFPTHYPYYGAISDINGQEKVSRTLLQRHTSFPADDQTDLMPRILDEYDQVILRKRCFDPFREPRADRMFSELRAEQFLIIGAVAEGAVKATVLGLLARHKNVTVLTDAVGYYNESRGNIVLRLMWVRGAKLIDTRALVSFSGQRLAAAHRIDY